MQAALTQALRVTLAGVHEILPNLKNRKVMTKMTIGRKQEGAEEQKSGIDDVSCHYPEESQTHRHNHHYHHHLRLR